MKPTSRRRSSVIAMTLILLVGLGIRVPGAFLISAAPAAQIVRDFGPVKDINSTGSSNPNNLTAFCCNRPPMFAADDGANGVELWVTDGTESGTFMVEDTNATGDSFPAGMTGDSITKYFSADDGTSGVELWRGSSNRASLRNDINPGLPSSFPMDFAETGGTIYFTADNG